MIFSNMSWVKNVQRNTWDFLAFFFCNMLKFTANTNAKCHPYDLLGAPKENAFGSKVTCILQYELNLCYATEPDVRANNKDNKHEDRSVDVPVTFKSEDVIHEYHGWLMIGSGCKNHFNWNHYCTIQYGWGY